MTHRPEVSNQFDGPAEGAVVQAGTITGDVNIGVRGPVVRSAYLEQVRRIAPVDLRERDAELTELAAFCTGSQGVYRWWQAPAWAGKSALMAWFVLHPPEGVRVVSFFVTARYAGQSDRIAFIDVLLEQLADLLDRPLPALLTEATREPHLLSMLTDAAKTCAAKDERLVLVVDGLDEDRGVLTGPDVHSIAAVLPTRPPANLRVVVAGRPHPPVPVDVPTDHPLRDKTIVRALDRSTHAAVVQADARRELLRLERGSALEQDLLGLVASAGGGLSGTDLVALTGARAWEVEEHLETVSGRAFAYRESYGTAPGVYVLGHEELQTTAVDHLGAQRLATYRDRVHTWADGYRDQGWPPGTPEYLMRGYFRLLRHTGDTKRMIACATDRARHDRMLDLTGGDSIALAEITGTQDFLVTQGNPDLLAMARLAMHRDTLTARNTHLPTNLPAVWAALGNPARAEALARSMDSPDRRAAALAEVACAYATLGDIERAKDLIDTSTSVSARCRALISFIKGAATGGRMDQAEAAAEYVLRIGNSGWELRARVSLAEAAVIVGDRDRAGRLALELPAFDDSVAVLAAVGDVDLAEEVARTIPDEWDRRRAMRHVVAAAFVAGDLDRAEALARPLGDDYQNRTLRAVAEAEAAIGHIERANALHRTIPRHSSLSMPQLAAMLTITMATGDLDLTRALVHTNEVWVHTRWENTPDTDLIVLVQALVAAGELDRAVAIAKAWESTSLLATIAAAAATFDAALAIELATEAETLARAIPQPTNKHGITTLATALGKAGDLSRVKTLLDHADLLSAWTIRLIGDPDPLVCAVAAMAEEGHVDRAETLARSHSGRSRQEALIALVEKLGTNDFVDRALALADTLDEANTQAEALLSLVRVMLATGDAERARLLAGRVDMIARAIPDDGWQAISVQNSAFHALLAVGDLDRAEAIGAALDTSYDRPRALALLAREAAAAGDQDRALKLIRLIDSDQLPPRDSSGQLAYPVVDVAGAMAAVGDVDRAVAFVRSIGDPRDQRPAMRAIIAEVVSTGQVDRAEELAHSVENIAERSAVQEGLIEALIANHAFDRAESLVPALPAALDQGKAWVALATAVAAEGDWHRARLVAERVPTVPYRNANGKAVLLVKVVQLLASDLDWAEPIADSITVPTQRAVALAALAEAHPDRAADLLGRAFQIGRWADPLDVLVRIDPTTAPVIAEELTALSQLPTEEQLRARDPRWRDG